MRAAGGIICLRAVGTQTLTSGAKDDRDNLASYHIHVLHAISGIRKSIPHIMLYSELQQAPLDHSWWVRVIQFWNNLAARPDSCIYKRVALCNCRAAFSGVQNWARSLMQSLLNLNYQFVLPCDRMDPIDHHRVMQLLNEKLLAVTQGLDPSPRLPYSKCCVVYLHALFPPSTVCAYEHDSQSLQIADPCCQAPCVLAFSYWLSRFAYCSWSFYPGAAFTAPMYSLPHCSNW